MNNVELHSVDNELCVSLQMETVPSKGDRVRVNGKVAPYRVVDRTCILHDDGNQTFVVYMEKIE